MLNFLEIFKSKIKGNSLLFVSIAISMMTYFRWLSFDYFVYADIHYFNQDKLSQEVIPSTWLSDHTIAHPEIQLWRVPSFYLGSILSIFGLESNVYEKIVFFWPVIFLLPIGSYLLVKKTTKSSIAAFIGSLVFSFNTYFLAINSQGHLPLTVACAFSNFAFLLFIKTLERKKLLYAVCTGLILFIVGSYDLRFLYIDFFLLAAYTGYYLIENKFTDLKEALGRIIYFPISFGIVIILSLFWILPAFFADQLVSNEVLEREIIFFNYWGILESMTLFHVFWDGTDIWQVVKPLPAYFLIIPVFAAAGYILNKNKKNYTFFLVIGVLGILLSKQNGAPFEGFYDWMYANFPGFSAFREATKFYYLIALSYAVLIGSLADFLYVNFRRKLWQKTITVGVVSSVVIIFTANLVPIFTGEIKSLYTPKDKQQEYADLWNYLQKQPAGYRTMLVPTTSIWMPYTNKHPGLNLNRTVTQEWQFLDNYQKISGKPFVDVLEQDFSDFLLDNTSIKYVAIPIMENENPKRDFSEHFNLSRNFYLDVISKIDYLEKVEDFDSRIELYENTNVKPRLYTTDKVETIYQRIEYEQIEHEQISSNKYRLKLRGFSEKEYLNLTDRYSENWKLKVGEEEINHFSVLFDHDYFLPQNTSFQNDGRLTSFILDADYIKRNYSKEYYTENSDGSIDVEMTLYYKPQSYFYAGAVISLSFLILCLTYLSYEAYRFIHHSKKS
jgi:hypothetical protein